MSILAYDERWLRPLQPGSKKLVAASTQYFEFSGTPVDFSTLPVTLFARYAPLTTAANPAIISLGKAGSSDRILMYFTYKAGTDYCYVNAWTPGGESHAGTTGNNVTFGEFISCTAVFAASNSRTAYFSNKAGFFSLNNAADYPQTGPFDKLYVGAYYNNGLTSGFYGDGLVADVAIWQRALSETEIRAISAGASPGNYSAGLIYFWPMAQGHREVDLIRKAILVPANNPTVDGRQPIAERA